MAVSQILAVTEVSGSVNTANNTSKVRILWTSTQSGESWNGYTRTAKYYVSINGGAETEYSIKYTLPQNSTQTIVDTTVVVTHKNDGTGSIKVRTWMDTGISAGVVEKSQSLALTTIARASEISSAADVTLGNKCAVKWTPKSTSYRYKLKFSIGDWSYTTGAIHPGKTSTYTFDAYTIPVLVAEQIPNAKSGTMNVTLYTYSDSQATTQLGNSNTATFTVTVPNNNSTKPAVSMTISPVSSLSSAFAGLYIQSKTKVKAALLATGKYEATVDSYSMKVSGRSYDAEDDYTSAFLTQYGTLTVTGYATDSRGYTGSTSKSISVIAYSKPTVTADAFRCDENGDKNDSGTYLKIIAKRNYSKVVSNGVQKNFCLIRYRYKLSSDDSYSAWNTILAKTSSSDEVTTGALLNGGLSVQSTYLVQVQVVDDIGEKAHTTISVPTEKVFCHRDGERNSITYGGYVDEDNAFTIARGMKFRVKSEEWISLGLSSNVSEAENTHGRAPSGCRYRIVNGNHVFVEFNCSFLYAGTTVVVNANALPIEYRPSRYTYSICALNNRAISRIYVSTTGNVCVNWVKDTAATVTDSYDVTWIDGHIDFFVS